jgi:hypothetical protein
MVSAVKTRRTRWLVPLVTPLLAGSLLVGCAGKGAVPTATPTPTTGTAGDEWLVVAQGSATPTPTPSRATPKPTATTRVLPRAPQAKTVPSPTCTFDTPDFARMVALDVVPGKTTAKVSWFNTGGYNLVQYRVTATSQDIVFGEQRDIGFVTVTPEAPCGPLSTTLTNLDRNTLYVFTVDAVVVRASGDGMHAATLFRSGPISTK